MVAMAELCGTRIRYSCILFHLIGGNLVVDVEEGGEYLIAVAMEWQISFKFSVRRFRSIQGFKGDNFGSRALVLRVTCTKTSRLS
jgi:hypothetical protein